MRKILLLIFLVFSPIYTYADENDTVNTILKTHYLTYKDKEFFSGITLSTYKPDEPIKNYYIGNISHQRMAKPIDADTLFQIGSITKSFTAVMVLQLQKENKLTLQTPLTRFLPEYSKWASITVESLLNMTNGLPNYSDSPLMNAQAYYYPDHTWKNKELIQFVYPMNNFSPPLKSGYFYSNTGYILIAMMLEKIQKQNFQTLIEKRLLQPLQLTNTFYPVPKINKKVYDRIAHGYGYNPYANPELVGQDVYLNSLSWAGAAGALLSNSSDVIKWVQALFVNHTLLDEQQQKALMQLVSTEDGKPVKNTSEKNPRAFGLGVIQGYDKSIGQYWFYEGETEGFRALYMYVPSNGIIISAIFNSAVNTENDHAGELMKKVYAAIIPTPKNN